MPAEHWVHLKTTNPIESTFATVGLRTKVTKGAGSRAAGLAMAHKLTRAAESPGARWWRARRALRGGGGVSPVRDDELLGLRHRLLALGASASLLDGLSPGRVAPAQQRTGRTARRQAGHRQCPPELRCPVPRRAAPRRLQFVGTPDRPWRPVPLLRRAG
jgi:hypothetical protein